MAVLFALLWYVLSRSFLGIVTSTGKTARREYKEKTVQRQSVSRALLGKELGRFTASANYMLNCGLGILLLPVGGIALLVKGRRGRGCVGTDLRASRLHRCAAVYSGLYAVRYERHGHSLRLPGRQKHLWLVQSLPIPLAGAPGKLSVRCC